MKLVISGKFGDMEKILAGEKMCNVVNLTIWTHGGELRIREVINKDKKKWQFLGFTRCFRITTNEGGNLDG